MRHASKNMTLVGFHNLEIMLKKIERKHEIELVQEITKGVWRVRYRLKRDEAHKPDKLSLRGVNG